MADKIDRLFIDKKDEDRFNKLKKTTRILNGKSNKEIFLLSMAMGYTNDVRVPIDQRHEYVRMEYLKPEDDALIAAIAVASNSAEILLDTSQVYKVAEEYAHGGAVLLESILDQPGSFEKTFEKMLLEFWQNTNKNENGENE